MQTVQEVNFTPKVHRTIELAKQKSFAHNFEQVTEEFLLFAVLRAESSIVNTALQKMGLNLQEVGDAVEKTLKTSERGPAACAPKMTPETQAVMDGAAKISGDMGCQYTGVEHVMLSLLAAEDSVAGKILSKLEIDAKKLSENIKAECKLMTKVVAPRNQNERVQVPTISNPEKSGLLEIHCTNYSQRAALGEFDMIFNRDKEAARVEEILCRKSKKNAIIVGDAGVGKSSLVGLIARRINNNQSTEFLMNRVIYGLDLASLVAGTRLRGEFEERLTQILTEVKADPRIILFIDEIHSIVGAGNQEGSLDASNILKPHLASGDFSCIGATTDDEYRRIFERDTALSRRFEKVLLREPTPQETEVILLHLKKFYEKFHRVSFPDEVIKDIVALTAKYMPGRRFPDKAIDILDQTGAKVKIKKFAKPRKLNDLQVQLEESMRAKDKSGMVKTLTEEFRSGVESWLKMVARKKAVATSSDVYETVSQKIGADISEGVGPGPKKKSLNDILNEVVVGQEHATRALSDCMLRAEFGLNNPEKPIGAFLFLGPTGVGKTMLAKCLAEFGTGDKSNLLQLDMSEYVEGHSVSRLTGAQPGYIGFDKGGVLAKHVANHPFSVVLLDEIEKAHPDVINLFLQIMDDGKLTASDGNVVSFRNVVLIATGNVGFQNGEALNKVGFIDSQARDGLIEQEVIERARKFFRPEFLSRMTKIVVLNKLTDDNLLTILDVELKKIEKGLKNRGIRMKVSPSVRPLMLKLYKKRPVNENGRGMTSLVDEAIKTKIVEFLSTGSYDSIVIDSDDSGTLALNGQKSPVLLRRK